MKYMTYDNGPVRGHRETVERGCHMYLSLGYQSSSPVQYVMCDINGQQPAAPHGTDITPPVSYTKTAQIIPRFLRRWCSLYKIYNQE